jgi:hypothetical protein
MVGPHLATAPVAGGLAASRQRAVRKFGARRGLGRIFGSSEGMAVYAAAPRPSLLDVLNEGGKWKTKLKPSGRKRQKSRENRPRRAVGTVEFDGAASLG